MCDALTCEAVTRGGATLSRLWRKVGACEADPRAKIQHRGASGRYSGTEGHEDFQRFVEKFAALARECEARPVFMCWAYERLAHRVSRDTVIEMQASRQRSSWT